MICIPLCVATNEEAIQSMARCASCADVVEMRIDALDKPDLSMLLTNRKGTILVTNRRRDEGGFFSGSEERRCALLLEAVALGADMVDVELRTDREWRGRIVHSVENSSGRTELILSYHDFEGTPGMRKLRSVVEESRRHGAHIVKIVTMACHMKDNLRLLELVQWADAMGQRIIGFCMGEKGRISRIAAPSFGSWMSYVALDDAQVTAPGQLTLEEAKTIMKVVRV